MFDFKIGKWTAWKRRPEGHVDAIPQLSGNPEVRDAGTMQPGMTPQPNITAEAMFSLTNVLKYSKANAFPRLLISFLMQSVNVRPCKDYSYVLEEQADAFDRVIYRVIFQQDREDKHLKEVLILVPLTVENEVIENTCLIYFNVRDEDGQFVPVTHRQIRLSGLELMSNSIRDFFEYGRLPSLL